MFRSQSRYLVNTLLSSKVWTREERWSQLNNININDVIVFYQVIVSFIVSTHSNINLV